MWKREMRKFALGAGVLLLLLCTILYEAAPEQLYRSWRESNRHQPAVAETAAENYLHISPDGPRAHDLQAWLNAHQQASIGGSAPKSQLTGKGAPKDKQAVAQPRLAAQAAPSPAETSLPSVTGPTPQARPQSPLREENNARAMPGLAGSQSGDTGLKPAGQSLEETLAFIADKIASQDKINITVRSAGDLVEQLSYQASTVTIDPNRCQISFHWHVVQDGKGTPDQNHAIRLGLAKSIREVPIERVLGDLDAAAGQGFHMRVHPEAYAVHIARWDGPSGDNLYFRSEATAARVSKAAHHAQELCGANRSGASR